MSTINMIRWCFASLAGTAIVATQDMFLELLSIVVIMLAAFANGVAVRAEIHKENDNA